MSVEKYKFNSKDLINGLVELLNDKKFKKQKPYPKFDIDEVRFLTTVIFFKPNKLLVSYVADYVINKKFGEHLSPSLFSKYNIKRLNFIFYFLRTKNATKAAILAGYSEKCAKQQGYRILKSIQEECRKNRK